MAILRRIWTISYDLFEVFIVFIALIIFFLIFRIDQDFLITISYIIPIWIIVVFLIHLNQFTIIEIQRSELRFISLKHKFTLPIPLKLKTWWQYDIPKSKGIYLTIDSEKRGAKATMEIIAEIQTPQGPIYLFDPLKYSSRFPSNHNYCHLNKTSNGRPVFYVNNMDKILSKLDNFITK